MSSAHLLSTGDLDLLSSDECQKFTAETIEIRKMVYTYRNRSSRLPTTNGGLPLIAELSSHLSPLALRAEVLLSPLVAPSLPLASGLAVVGEMPTRAIGKGPS
jgi:hypothetical protein